jgi:hypothetical protein
VDSIRFEVTELVDIAPHIAWDILADYPEGHAKIVPQPYFRDFVIEEGGKGEGTTIHFTFHLWGTTRHVRHRVSTPEPGRVLTETELPSGGSTTFTINPVDHGKRARIRILTELDGAPGIAGAIQRLLAPAVAHTMQRIYRQELANLETLGKTWHVESANAPTQ